MTHNYSSLVLSLLRQVDGERFERAVNSLAQGFLSLTLTRQQPQEIRALVRNGEGKEYGVTLTEAVATCSCKDALYRGVICKHAVAVALSVLRAPQPQVSALQTPAPQSPPCIHLMWRDGIVLCGVPEPDRFWVYPWTDNVWNWPDICSDCKAAWKQPAARSVAA